MNTGSVKSAPQPVPSDPHAELLAQIKTRHPTHRSVWILFDPAMNPMYEDETSAAWLDLAERMPVQVAIPGYGLGVERCPLWLQADLTKPKAQQLLRATVEGARDELHPDALRRNNGRRVCAWVCSPPNAKSTPDALRAQALHMAGLLVQTRPNLPTHYPYLNGRPVHVRLQDPAVLWALWPLFNSMQKSQWLAHVGGWWMLKPNGQMHALQALQADAPMHSPRAVPHALDMRFTPDQWTSVPHIQPLNHALRKWLQRSLQDNPLAELADLDVDNARDGACAAIRTTDNAGWRDLIDLQAVAYYAMAYHPRFDTSTLIRNHLAQRMVAARKDDAAFDLAGWLHVLSASDWQRVVAQLNHVEPPAAVA